MEFDGSNDYVSVADDNSLDLSSAMTIEFWIYLDEDAGKDVLSKSNDDADENFRIYINQSANQIYFYYGDGDDYTQTTAFTLNLNSWYHMAFTVSAGSTGSIYVNGQEASSYSNQANAKNPIPTNTHAMEIGGCNSQERYFNGSLDELRLWNDIRLVSEIRQNMYQELSDPSSETNLVAYYKLNSTSGSTATDQKEARWHTD